VFCGVLWCFAVFCVRVFSVFHKTAQNRPKNIYKTNKTNKVRFRFVLYLCKTAHSAIRCCASFSHSDIQKMYTKKHSQNTSKTLQTIHKTQNTAKHSFSKNTRKTPQNTPQNTRRTPQNTAKHHKTHLLTKQTELANKPLRSRPCPCPCPARQRQGTCGRCPARSRATLCVPRRHSWTWTSEPVKSHDAERGPHSPALLGTLRALLPPFQE